MRRKVGPSAERSVHHHLRRLRAERQKFAEGQNGAERVLFGLGWLVTVQSGTKSGGGAGADFWLIRGGMGPCGRQKCLIWDTMRHIVCHAFERACMPFLFWGSMDIAGQ